MLDEELRELLVSKVRQLQADRLPDLAAYLCLLECGGLPPLSNTSAPAQYPPAVKSGGKPPHSKTAEPTSTPLCKDWPRARPSSRRIRNLYRHRRHIVQGTPFSRTSTARLPGSRFAPDREGLRLAIGSLGCLLESLSFHCPRPAGCRLAPCRVDRLAQYDGTRGKPSRHDFGSQSVAQLLGYETHV